MWLGKPRSSLLLLLVLMGPTAIGACQGQRKTRPTSTGTGGRSTTGPTGGAGGTTRGTGGASGAAGAPAAACTGPADSRLVVAPQRVLRLTVNETVNTIRYLIDNTEAQNVVTAFVGGDDDALDRKRQFPPLQNKTFIGQEFLRADQVADHVGAYVEANYATLTTALAGCSTATDACARSYLGKLVARAYRRPPTDEELARFMALYDRLRSQVVNGYDVPGTVEEATGSAVYALFSSPQLLWRTEFGDAAKASTAPAGVPLTDPELATQVAFFLNDQPPDDTLLAAAATNTLRPNLETHVRRLLGTQPARDWLRTIVETYFLINRLPEATIDPMLFPVLTEGLRTDIQVEARKFLDNVLWTGSLSDLLISRTTFLNAALASNIYEVPIPPGANSTTFVQTTLPSDRRAGLLTNAAFLLSMGNADGNDLMLRRAKMVAWRVACTPIMLEVIQDMDTFERLSRMRLTQTGQQQVAARNAVAECRDCHRLFDPYGLALENYDVLGRLRDTYSTLPGTPTVDASAVLPVEIGGQRVKNAVELAEVLAASPAFTNCMATAMLQYALVDWDTAYAEAPVLPFSAGCAAADVARRYDSSATKTFSDLISATAASPAFVLRRTTP